MGIDRIGGYGSAPGYAALRGTKIVEAEKAKQENFQSQPDTLKPEPVSAHEDSSRPQRGKDAELEDISLTFNKQESFDYLGRESDIRGLDLRKAISDMRKDQILQQYHFFVGSVKDLVESSLDGTVVKKG